MILRAYVDESEPDQRHDPGCYLLAAAIIPDDLTDHARRVLRQLRCSGPAKVHWFNESEQRRKQISEAVAALDLAQIVVVRAGTHESTERRRRLCLRALLTTLYSQGVGEVFLEARQRKQDAADFRVVDVLKAQRLVGHHIRVEHQPGPTEPLLWIPDILGGIVGAHRRGESSYFDQFADRIQIVEV